MSKLKQLFTLAIVVSFLAGCTQVSRKLGDLTDNKYAKPRSGTVWVVPPPDLEPPSSANKTVYVSYRNISDADIEILDLLKTSAQDQGFQDPYTTISFTIIMFCLVFSKILLYSLCDMIWVSIFWSKRSACTAFGLQT